MQDAIVFLGIMDLGGVLIHGMVMSVLNVVERVVETNMRKGSK